MSEDIFQTIKDQIAKDRIVLYMKGTPALPQCGFSQVTADILRRLEEPFESYDVLQDPSLREGIKQYSDWPTIPQLYVDGEFVGGCDIVRSMYESGDLEKVVKSS